MFNGVLALKNSEKRCFSNFLEVRKKDDTDKKVFPRFLNPEKKKFRRRKIWFLHYGFTVRKKGSSTVFQRQKKGFSTVVFGWAIRCFNGVWMVRNKVFRPRKKRCAHIGFTVTKKVFQRCLKGYKKIVSTVKKKFFPNGFTVRKTVVLSVFEWWKRKLFRQLKKRCFHCGFTLTNNGVSTVAKKRCLNDEKGGLSTVILHWEKRCFNGVRIVGEKLFRLLKRTCFHSDSTVAKEVCQRWQQQGVRTVEKEVFFHSGLPWEKRFLNSACLVRKIIVSMVKKEAF